MTYLRVARVENWPTKSKTLLGTDNAVCGN
jgi:hypothetical protein